MAMFPFDATQVNPDAGRSLPVPKGEYPLMLVESEIKPAASGNGYYIAGVFEIVDGEFKGRQVYHNYNIKHTNPKAEEIGKGQFSALCHAVGVLKIEDTAQLHNVPFVGTVKLVKGNLKKEGNPATGETAEFYDDSNEITGYKAMSAPAKQAAFTMPAQAPAQQPVQQPVQQPAFNPEAATTTQPWQNQQPVQQPVQQPPQAAGPVDDVPPWLR